MAIHNITKTGPSSLAEGFGQVAALALVMEPASTPATTLVRRGVRASSAASALVVELPLLKRATQGSNELSEVFIRRYNNQFINYYLIIDKYLYARFRADRKFGPTVCNLLDEMDDWLEHLGTPEVFDDRMKEMVPTPWRYQSST